MIEPQPSRTSSLDGLGSLGGNRALAKKQSSTKMTDQYLSELLSFSLDRLRKVSAPSHAHHYPQSASLYHAGTRPPHDRGAADTAGDRRDLCVQLPGLHRDRKLPRDHRHGAGSGVRAAGHPVAGESRMAHACTGPDEAPCVRLPIPGLSSRAAQDIPELASACESFSSQSAVVLEQYTQNKQLAGEGVSCLHVDHVDPPLSPPAIFRLASRPPRGARGAAAHGHVRAQRRLRRGPRPAGLCLADELAASGYPGRAHAHEAGKQCL